MLCEFLLWNNMNQPFVYISPHPLEPSSYTPHPLFHSSRSSEST